MTTRIPTTEEVPTSTAESSTASPMRKTAAIAGVSYLATFVFSIPVKFGFWADVLENSGFIIGKGSAAGVPMGAVFEVLDALTCVGTSVASYSVAKRYSHRAALGFVATRLMEAGLIFVGALSVLTVYTLRHDVAGTPGADARSLITTGRAFVALHDWTFLLGPGFMPVLNALLIGSVMYRSRLVPRWIPTLGLIGAPLLLTSSIANLFGAWEQVSTTSALLTLPIAVWEYAFGVYMTFWGFRSATVDPAGFTAVNASIPVVS